MTEVLILIFYGLLYQRPSDYRARFGVRARRSCVVSYLVVFERHVRYLSHKLAQHVCSCFVFATERCMLRG